MMNMMTGAVAINGGVGVMEIHQPQVAVSQMAASAAQAAEQVALNAHITLRELKTKIDTVVEKKRPTSEYEDEEMEANTDIYAEFIISKVERIKETCPHPLVMVEERLDYSYLVPQGFGTGDCVIIADGTLYVMDYKNGKGVFVNCDHNPQMMLYALGAYHAYGYLYSIKKVSMTIIQPRLENISTFECSVEELLDWAETYVRPRAKLAFEGKGEQVPGDWCRFCRARTSCKACADEAMALVKEEFLDLDAGVLEDETEETDATASFAQEHGKKVIIISTGLRRQYDAKYVSDCGPEEFLGYFKAADTIFTNSFHGIAFSILFNKQFYYQLQGNNVKTNSRLYDIISLFQLEKRNINNINNADCIDYSFVNTVIEQKRKSAIDYLKNQIVG